MLIILIGDNNVQQQCNFTDRLVYYQYIDKNLIKKYQESSYEIKTSNATPRKAIEGTKILALIWR